MTIILDPAEEADPWGAYGGSPQPDPLVAGPHAEPISAHYEQRHGLVPTKGHSASYDGAYRVPAGQYGRDMELSVPVVVAEHHDAEVACASAAAEVAALVEVAHRQGYTEVVGVVVVEDVTAACDEDGGF